MAGKSSRSQVIIAKLNAEGPKDIDGIYAMFPKIKYHLVDAALQSAITEGYIKYKADFKYHATQPRQPRPPLPDGYGDHMPEEYYTAANGTFR